MWSKKKSDTLLDRMSTRTAVMIAVERVMYTYQQLISYITTNTYSAYRWQVTVYFKIIT
jgi:hypothetical protein